MPTSLPADTALVVVDVQSGFDDPTWGRRNNPACDDNIARLIKAFSRSGRPVVYVRHDSRDPSSPLHPASEGNALKPYLGEHRPDVVISKSVNSSFHGSPDLHEWLTRAGVTGVVIAGITTNHCCETTARVGGNLGYTVHFALDATHTFDRESPDGTLLTADELSRATATNLHGEFATVVTTEEVLSALRG
ncbi:isochorismatase family protein [Nostocoides sp. F2B08]|uniref:cysteine hydrolase family protein n=1 Tax=Nostocoides sp. F2B08 TaxID=2653936 RepID=UPI0012634267|nr:cysteine hydrolase family protein [Tetrasphaera sp. F2B08]KAB7744704.1 isochorismatase family protein [Tetrasphaera sp. F2B08]